MKSERCERINENTPSRVVRRDAGTQPCEETRRSWVRLLLRAMTFFIFQFLTLITIQNVALSFATQDALP